MHRFAARKSDLHYELDKMGAAIAFARHQRKRP